jgi:hypothetical protein
MCTPEAGGAEAPCPQQDYDKMKAKDEQYAEAEKVYREFTEEYVTVMRAGGAEELPSSLRSLLGDKDLESQIRDQIRDFKSAGIRVIGPGIEIVTVARRPGTTRNGSAVTMAFCIDASRMTMYKGKHREGAWGRARDTIYFGPTGSGSLAMVASDSVGVKACG